MVVGGIKKTAAVIATVWFVAVCATTGLPASAAAQATPAPAKETQPKNRGLYITPIRTYVTVKAGTTKKGNFTVANYTDKPSTISFSIKQFSVADYNYAFKFDEAVGTRLVTIAAPDTLLKPSESKTIPYEITIPGASTPGGRYYTVLATATSSDPNVREKVQAASLIYLTVDGKLTYNNNIGATTIKKLVFGNHIGFTLDVSNTGNTHYFMFLQAQLHGPLTSKSSISESHLLLPIKTRHLESAIPSPVLPGIYKATYGYRTEYTPAVERSAWVVFIPPWFIGLLLVLGWIGYKLYRRRTASSTPTPSDAAQSDTTDS